MKTNTRDNITGKTRSAVLQIFLLALAVPTTGMAHHVSASGPTNSVGPINTVTPDTLGKGKVALNFASQAVDYDSFSNAQLEDFARAGFEEVHSTNDALVWSLGLEYGLTDRFSVGLVVPFFQRSGIREGELEEDGASEVHVLGDVRGLGDITVLAKYRLVDAGKRGRFALSVIGGAELPTGSTDERQSDGRRFEQEFQPGSGATNVLLGLSGGRTIGQVGVYGNVLYTFVERGAQNTHRGDVFAYNLGASYRIGRGGHLHGDGTFERHQAVDLVVEVNGEWHDKERIGATSDPHSGGSQLFLSPGIRYFSEKAWSASLSVGIPVDENLNGIQNDSDARIYAGFSFDLFR